MPSVAAVPTPEQSQAPVIQAAVPPPQVPIVQEEPAISGAPPPPGHSIVAREERVEYRDQHGNLLDEEQVKALEGKVEFQTRYETRTRLVDADGNEIPQSVEPEPAVAPPHPDVQGMIPPTPPRIFRGLTHLCVIGVDSETTKRSLVPDEPIAPPKKSVEGVKEAEEKVAKPASEGNEATKLASEVNEAPKPASEANEARKPVSEVNEPIKEEEVVA